ncbi:hypothetical protein KR032_007250 [Drosophila birchii]|nr:hypothetical protein KR032_007250 [Drosophila birchii]
MITFSTEKSPVVQTTHGKVRGTLLKGLYDDQFYAFDGIPYAKPPLGALRFKEPQDVESWDGIRDCSKPLDKCLQVSSYTKLVEGSEDCLYLNISVKSLKSNKPLPLMVYVHGGGFKGGDSSRRAWGPDYFMRENVIHVSIGYRLGPFGFFAFKDPSLEIPGNAGLKDVVLALRWIRANAASFNGDPDNITLFGHSSGSMTVQLLLASPQTEGLFHKAILMAGFLMEVSRLPDMEYRLAKHLGYKGENIDRQVLDFLLQADPHRLASANFFTDEEKGRGYSMPFRPSLESYATPGAVLLAEPIILMRSTWSNSIPLILGANTDEGLFAVSGFSTNPTLLKDFQTYPERVLPETLKDGINPSQQRAMGVQLSEFFCHAHGQDLNMGHLRALANIFSIHLLHLQERVIRSRLAFSQAPTYLYRFDFDSPDFNFYRIRYFGPHFRGVCHVDELGYIYVMPATFKLDKSRPEFSAIWRMIAMWTQFAATSNPNAPLTKPLVDWKPLTSSGTLMLLHINEELMFIPQPEKSSLDFVDGLYEQAGITMF